MQTLMTDEKKETRVYEVGYLLTPHLPEEKVGETVTHIKSILEKEGVFFIADEFPKLRVLAYTIEKPIAGKREKYQNAYFGWIKFEATGEAAVAIKKALSNERAIIRFLIIKTIREIPSAKFYVRRETLTEEKKPVKADAPASPKPVISEAELDKTIAELVAE